MNVNIREIIAETLYALETSDRKSHLLIRDVLDKYDWLPGRDKAFFKRVTEGSVSMKLTLDYVLDRVSKKPMAKCKPMIRVILRMSAYQMLYMDKVPESAAVNEAVKLCGKLAVKELCPFVNAVLRNLSKLGKEALDFSEISDNIKRLSITYSVPEWIVSMFVKEQPGAESLLKALNERSATTVYIADTEKTEEILLAWKDAGLTFEESPLVDGAYRFEALEGARMLPGFNEGHLLIMDESSMIAALATGIKKGDDLTFVDCCAAPGGKSAFVAKKMMPHGKVLSRDLSENKAEYLSENFERLKLTNTEITVWDATVLDESLIEAADVVLVDAPCSGLGVIGKKSDVRYNISNEAMKEISRIQKEILENAAKYVKPGGVLVYSTCTIHRAENERTVKFILDKLPFSGDSLKPFAPKLFDKERECDYMLQLRPDIDGCDGFFISRFIKNK